MSKSKRLQAAWALIVAAVLAVVGVTFASAASATTGHRQPATGSYNCSGIPVAIYHDTTVIGGVTNHRVSAWYLGKSVTNPSTPYNANEIQHVTFREQDSTHSLGGTDSDWSPNYVLGAYSDPTTLGAAPWHAGVTVAAFDIAWWTPTGQFHSRCSIQL